MATTAYTKKQLLHLRHSNLVQDPDENPAAVVWDWVYSIDERDLTPDPINTLDIAAVQGHWSSPLVAEIHPYASNLAKVASRRLDKYMRVSSARSRPVTQSSPKLRPQAQPFAPPVNHLTDCHKARLLDAMAMQHKVTCDSPTRSHSTHNSLDLAMGQLTLKDSFDAHNAADIASRTLLAQSNIKRTLKNVSNYQNKAHDNFTRSANFGFQDVLHEPGVPLPGNLQFLWGLEFGSHQENIPSNHPSSSPDRSRFAANIQPELHGQQGDGSYSIARRNQYDRSILTDPPQILPTTPFLPFTYRLKKGCWPQNDFHLLEFSALHIAERQTLDLMNTAEDVEAMSFCGCERAVAYRRSRALSLGLSAELFQLMYPFLHRALKGKWPANDEEFRSFARSCRNGDQYELGRMNSYGVCDCIAAVRIRLEVLEKGERFDFMAVDLEGFELGLHSCYQVERSCHQMGMPARGQGYMPNREHVEHAHALVRHQQLFGGGSEHDVRSSQSQIRR